MKQKMMDIQKFSFTGWCPKMAHNVLHIPEGGDYEARNYKLTQMFNRSTDVHFSTNTPLLGICCYSQCF
jgi:hypothetical protein